MLADDERLQTIRASVGLGPRSCRRASLRRGARRSASAHARRVRGAVPRRSTRRQRRGRHLGRSTTAGHPERRRPRRRARGSRRRCPRGRAQLGRPAQDASAAIDRGAPPGPAALAVPELVERHRRGRGRETRRPLKHDLAELRHHGLSAAAPLDPLGRFRPFCRAASPL